MQPRVGISSHTPTGPLTTFVSLFIPYYSSYTLVSSTGKCGTIYLCLLGAFACVNFPSDWELVCSLLMLVEKTKDADATGVDFDYIQNVIHPSYSSIPYHTTFAYPVSLCIFYYSSFSTSLTLSRRICDIKARVLRMEVGGEGKRIAGQGRIVRKS